MSRIIYITVRSPLGTGEEFVIPEMMELIRQKQVLLIVPRSPSGSQVMQAEATALQPFCVYQPLLSWDIVRACLQELVQKPFKCLQLFLRLLFYSGKISHLCKNLLVFPKGLWLARLAREWDAEHLHAHWAASTATIAMIAGELTGIPWSFTAHRWDIVENNMLEAKAQSAAFVRFISHSGLSLAHKIINGNLLAKCHVIHMGVLIGNKISVDMKETKKQFTIMCPANLVPVKGHIHLLQAVAELKNRNIACRLLLAGQGPLLNKLRQKVDELEINDCVSFLGHLSHNELLEYYEQNRVNIVVLPSIDLGNGHHEGIPVALIEAMAHGIPVISTATGGIPELLRDGAGVLIPPKNSKWLADDIINITTDMNLYKKFSNAGYERVNQEFNIKKNVNVLLEKILEAIPKPQIL